MVVLGKPNIFWGGTWCKKFENHWSKGLCLYCGDGGQVISSCPTRPPWLLVSSIQPVPQNTSPLTLVVTLITPHITLPVHALLDSGSAGSFISGSLCRQLKIPTAVNPRTYQSITGKSLSRHYVRYLAGPITLRVGHLHEDNIQLLVLEEANTDIILGRPWFAIHEPQIACRTEDVLKWGNQCFPDCFPSLPWPSPPAKPILSLNAKSIESPVDQQSVDIPENYSHFRDVFCPKKATQLPPHRPWDCAIDLLPGESVPTGKIYVTSTAKGHGGVYRRGSPTGLNPPFYLPCCFKFLFLWPRRTEACSPVSITGHWIILQWNSAIHFLSSLQLWNISVVPLSSPSWTSAVSTTSSEYVRGMSGRLLLEWKTPTGHYEYLVMPYGLVNAPSVFQDFMHEVLRDYPHRFVLVYIDDILIYSRSLVEHRHHVAEVLQRLRQLRLFLKADKGSFHQPSVQFLGYHIDSSGIRMDEGKVEAIKTWSQPTTIKELQRFLGFSNFYRCFIQIYSTLTNPLTNLLRNKPKSLSWSIATKEAFEKLKTSFTQAPILIHPDPERPFIVEVDASTTGVGAILSQQQGNPSRLHPCAFFSRKLSPAERNYDIGNRELLGVV